MKKIILTMVILSIISIKSYSENYFLDLAIRPGVNMASTLEKYQVNNNNINFTLGAELGVNLGYLTIGGGATLNNSITFEDTSIPLEGSFKNMPVYGFAKFNIFPIIFKPYVVGKLGVNYISEETGFGGEEVKGGSYWAMGLGFDIYNFLAELVYQNSLMKIGSHEEELSQLQLTVGFKIF